MYIWELGLFFVVAAASLSSLGHQGNIDFIKWLGSVSSVYILQNNLIMFVLVPSKSDNILCWVILCGHGLSLMESLLAIVSLFKIVFILF